MGTRTEHYLPYDEMRARLARGETIIYHPPDGSKPRVFSSLSDLPDEATLVQGDAQAEAAALNKIDAEIARLAAQRSLLVNKSAEPAADADSGAPGKGSKKSTAKADDATGDPGSGTPPETTGGKPADGTETK